MVPPARGVREGLRGGAWSPKLSARRAIQHQGRAAWQSAGKHPSGKTRRVAGSFLDAENCSSLLAHLAKTDFAWLSSTPPAGSYAPPCRPLAARAPARTAPNHQGGFIQRAKVRLLHLQAPQRRLPGRWRSGQIQAQERGC